jgi:hypothetical protein
MNALRLGEVSGRINDALGLASAVHAHEVAEMLPSSAGLYAIWSDATLLYIGKSSDSVGVRRRVLGHLHLPGGKGRPNETLPLLLLDRIIRPNMQEDDRTCVEIALDFLRTRCLFAGWAWDRTETLGAWESRAIAHGVGGHRPLCNWPGS